MNRMYVVVFCLLALAGCVDKAAEENARKAALYDSLQSANTKQQKLEACVAKADSDSSEANAREWKRLGCGGDADSLPVGLLERCNAATDYSKQMRLEAEERCVKLYK